MIVLLIMIIIIFYYEADCMKNKGYVPVRVTCALCGNEINTKMEKYKKSPDGRFFHLRHYKGVSIKDPMEKMLGKYYKS